MRFALAQLRKLQKPYIYEEDLDLSEELNGFEDIVSIESCHITTKVIERGYDTYIFEFKIKALLILTDSVTLDEIEFPIDIDALDTFTTDTSIEDAYLITTETVDTKEAILADILINKPMNYSIHEFVDEVEEDEEEQVNPAFSSLKDLL